MNKTERFPSYVVAVVIVLAAGCASAPKATDPVVFTEQALAATAPEKVSLVQKGSPAEKRAIEGFKVFNGDFSKDNILKNTRMVYAPDLYFRDPFKEIRGEPDFEAYLLRGADSVSAFSMEWTDVSESNGNYYFRWTMSVKLNRDSKDAPPGRTSGISHVRFGADGKVIFHQDYFDGASLVYERIPVLGSAIRAIKKRM